MDKIEEIKSEVNELKIKVTNNIEAAKKVSNVCNKINNSWSGSDLVGHANLFYGNYETPPTGGRFSIEWGLIHGIPNGWDERSGDDIRQKIEADAKVSLKDLDTEADQITDKFEEIRKKAIVVCASLSKDLSVELEKFIIKTKVDIFNQYWKRQITTRDSEAIYAGRIIPVHKYYEATAFFIDGANKQLEDFIHLIDKLLAQNKVEPKQSTEIRNISYLDKHTLLRLTKIENEKFDLSRLIAFCKELDDNYSLGNYYSCAMILRAILDHIPPIFDKSSFDDVYSKYGGKSFKDIVKPLNETARKIGDNYLHTQIDKKVIQITKTQVDFQANIDFLLNEVAKILENDH